MDYLWVMSLGVVVGIGELLSRYRDAPWRAVRNPAAAAYLGTNALAAFGALVVIRAMPLTFGVTSPNAVRTTQVLVAGFGAMALFRTSLFLMKVGDRDIGIGPSTFLHMILFAADRDVDRRRAVDRAATVTKALEGLSFEQVKEALPRYCLTLMQNVSKEEQAEVARAVRDIDVSDMDSVLKVNALGLSLMNVVGRNVLVAAAASLKSRIVKHGVLDVYPSLREALAEVNTPDLQRLDVMGLTLYTAWPHIRTWLEEDQCPLRGWTLTLRCMKEPLGQRPDWIDDEWWSEADRHADQVAMYAEANAEWLHEAAIELSVRRYCMVPAFHGFRIATGTYFISYLSWQEDPPVLARPHAFYEIIGNGDQSVRANEYRQLFDNWLDRMDESCGQSTKQRPGDR